MFTLKSRNIGPWPSQLRACTPSAGWNRWPGRRPITAISSATLARRSGRASSASAMFVNGPSATMHSAPSTSALRNACDAGVSATSAVRPAIFAVAPAKCAMAVPPSAASRPVSSATVRSTPRRGALPNTVEMPAMRMPLARASAMSARQSSASVLRPSPQAASVSIQTRPGGAAAASFSSVGQWRQRHFAGAPDLHRQRQRQREQRRHGQ